MSKCNVYIFNLQFTIKVIDSVLVLYKDDI